MAELSQFQNYGMELMSIDPLVELKFSEEFKNKLRDLSKKYRNIRADLQPVLDDLQAGNFQGDQIANVGYTVFKLRIKNRDNKKGKSAGYRVIYYVKTATSVFLVTIYSKSEQSNIPASEIRRILTNYE
jgi:mRNA-degrading endonuclease RelE of RelBE toxin-antitoxin system